MENHDLATPWADLPQDILRLIFGELEYAADLVRFRAVCKNWHLPKDMLIKYKYRRNLPWLCKFSWVENQSDCLQCEIYDPYSRLKFKASILVENEKRVKQDNYTNKVSVYGSKQGWLIAGYFDKRNNVPDNKKYSMFLYNPHSKRYISFMYMTIPWHKPCFATFYGNPVSQKFTIFLFMRDEVGRTNAMFFHDYNENMVCTASWILEFGNGPKCRGMQYLNEQLFCLYDNGIIERRSLIRGSFRKIPSDDNQHLSLDEGEEVWLAKGGEDLLVAVKRDSYGNCSTFCFDSSNTSWVEKDLPKDSAIFISGDITIFVSPFVDYENKKDCNVYLFGEFVSEKELTDYHVMQICV